MMSRGVSVENRSLGMMSVSALALVLVMLFGFVPAHGNELLRSGINEKSLVAEIEDLKGQVKERNLWLKQEQERSEKLKGYQDILKEMSAVEEQLVAEGANIRAEREKIELAKEKMAEFEENRDQYIDTIRTRAKGEMINLSATQGEGFENCRILSVTPLHLSVMTATGPIGIEYQKLPPSLQERFHFSKKEAAAYSAWIKLKNEQESQRIADFRKKQRGLKAEEAIAAEKRELEGMELKVKQLENEIVNFENQALEWDDKASEYTEKANIARARGRVTSMFGQATQARNKATNLRNQAMRKKDEVEALKNTLGRLRADNE